MPCRDEFAEEEERRSLVDKVQQLTELLCLACKTSPPKHARVKAWWNQHQKDDAARKKRLDEDAEYTEAIKKWEAQRPVHPSERRRRR